MLTSEQDPHEFPAPGDAPPAWPVEPPHAGPPPLTRRRAIAEAVLCSSYPTQLVAAALLAVLGLRGATGDGGLSAPFIIAVSLLDLKSHASEWFEMDVFNADDARLDLARSDEGAVFRDFSVGTWVIGVACSTCYAPFPLWVAQLEVEQP